MACEDCGRLTLESRYCAVCEGRRIQRGDPEAVREAIASLLGGGYTPEQILGELP